MKKILALIMALAMVLVLGACGGNADQTDAEYIEEKGTLVIGYTLFAPMNYLDENEELTGFEVEFGKAVCEKLGVEPVFQLIDWNAKETELNSKAIDCIWNGMTIDEYRLENMSVSTPYMANKQVLVVKADKAAALTSVDGLSIVAEAESAGETVATKDAFFANANYTAVDSQAKALMEVKAGTADGCVVDYVCSIGMIGEGTDYADLAVVESKSFAEEEYGIAFRKGSDMTAKVNAAITELVNDGTLADIAAKYKLSEQLIAK